jgi:hypothetical protein
MEKLVVRLVYAGLSLFAVAGLLFLHHQLGGFVPAPPVTVPGWSSRPGSDSGLQVPYTQPTVLSPEDNHRVAVPTAGGGRQGYRIELRAARAPTKSPSSGTEPPGPR